jgi:hypothetical protein
MAALPSRLEYHDLSGSEVFDLIHTRVFDFLSQIPELKPHLALSRVVVRLDLTLDIWGTGERFHHDEVEMIAPEKESPDFVPIESHPHFNTIIDSRSSPPDQLREEHGLPVPRSVRNPNTQFHETSYETPDVPPKYPRAPQPDRSKLPAALPANQPNPNAKNMGRRRFAAVVVQDYGALAANERVLTEPPIIGADKIAMTAAGSDHGPVQPDFAAADFRQLDEEKIVSITQNAIERGRRIDQELEWVERPVPEEDEGSKE